MGPRVPVFFIFLLAYGQAIDTDDIRSSLETTVASAETTLTGALSGHGKMVFQTVVVGGTWFFAVSPAFGVGAAIFVLLLGSSVRLAAAFPFMVLSGLFYRRNLQLALLFCACAVFAYTTKYTVFK